MSSSKTNTEALYNLNRDERDRAATDAILREAQRWGHSLSESMAQLYAARALDAADKVEKP